MDYKIKVRIKRETKIKMEQLKRDLIKHRKWSAKPVLIEDMTR